LDPLTREEESRRAFQEGNLISNATWPYTYTKFRRTDGSSKVNGKFGIAPIPGLTTRNSTLGGHDLAISKFTRNKLTALNFIKFNHSQQQENDNLQATSEAPTWPPCTTNRRWWRSSRTCRCSRRRS